MLAWYCLLLLFLNGPMQSPTLPSTPAPSQDALDRAATESQLKAGTHPPVLLYQVDPEFPQKVRKKGRSGDVRVSFVVDVTGIPRDLLVTRSAGADMDEAALAAVRQYRYKPAMLDGKAVPMKYSAEVNFQIF